MEINSREKILAAVHAVQGVGAVSTGSGVEGGAGRETETPVSAHEERNARGAEDKASCDTEDKTSCDEKAAAFVAMLGSIGGTGFLVPDFKAIAALVHERFADAKRILSGCPELEGMMTGQDRKVEVNGRYADVHTLEDTDLALLRGAFGVAENAAVWITEEGIIERALPFICQHLALVIEKKDIVATMSGAYERIGDSDYDFGVFIAGPSKTADIEQSLVLGAHGPVSMTVFILE